MYICVVLFQHIALVCIEINRDLSSLLFARHQDVPRQEHAGKRQGEAEGGCDDGKHIKSILR